MDRNGSNAVALMCRSYYQRQSVAYGTINLVLLHVKGTAGVVGLNQPIAPAPIRRVTLHCM